MDRYLKGKTAFLTGSFANLGLVVAGALADRGANIVINDLPGRVSGKDQEALIQSVRRPGVDVMAVEGDVSDLESLEGMRETIESTLGPVSIVVNCAGPFNLDPYLQLDPGKWDLVMNVNLKAVYLTGRVFAPAMIQAGWGRIVNLSAGSSLIRNHGVYGLAKAGVSFLTEELATELGSSGITVNAIAPGQIEESLPEVHKIDPTFGARYTARTPLGRLVTRKDIAGVIAYLCSPDADMLTGLTIRADGGAELPRF